MDEELLGRLLQFVEEASPFVWAAVRRQAIIDYMHIGFWAAVLGGACWQLAGMSKNKMKNYRDDADGYVFAIAAVLTGFAALGLLAYLTGIVASPDYYAIRLLLNLVR